MRKEAPIAHEVLSEPVDSDIHAAQNPAESLRPPRKPRLISRLLAASALTISLASCATESDASAQQEAPAPATASTTDTTTPTIIANRVPPVVQTPSNPESTSESRYLYAGGMQYVEATGASVELAQDRPYTQYGDHSLVELAAQSSDGEQIVEVGWTVDESLNGDTLPRLFVYHWEDRIPSCYNACGFVQVSDTIEPGDPVDVGETGTYGIRHVGNQWQISYNSELVGYYPDSLWAEEGGFTEIGLVQAFGEIATQSEASCSDMGNGIYGNDPEATQISDYRLEGTELPKSLRLPGPIFRCTLIKLSGRRALGSAAREPARVILPF